MGVGSSAITIHQLLPPPRLRRTTTTMTTISTTSPPRPLPRPCSVPLLQRLVENVSSRSAQVAMIAHGWMKTVVQQLPKSNIAERARQIRFCIVRSADIRHPSFSLTSTGKLGLMKEVRLRSANCLGSLCLQLARARCGASVSSSSAMRTGRVQVLLVLLFPGELSLAFESILKRNSVYGGGVAPTRIASPTSLAVRQPELR